MIRKYVSGEESELLTTLTKNAFINPYFRINLQTYGVCGAHVGAWQLGGDGEAPVLLYGYYRTAQLICGGVVDEVGLGELIDFILSRGLVMVSGPNEVIQQIAVRLGDGYRATSGVLMELKGQVPKQHVDVRSARFDDLEEVAMLICDDPEIGGHYRLDELHHQLVERWRVHGCRNYVIEDKKGLLSHAGTYAESIDSAVLGGVVTRKDARGRGLGSKVFGQLAYDVSAAGKRAYLYCYQDGLTSWYENLGWEVVGKSAKLEKIAGDFDVRS